MGNIFASSILEDTKAQSLSSGAESFEGVGTDTRKDLSGQLFIALRGENFDAHQFLETAVQKGAAGLLVDKWDPAWNPLLKKVAVFQVKETLKGLQDLGHGHRRRNKAAVISMTGSNGKTTTKEFTTALLSAYKNTSSSLGSFNNHWGVPLSLLQIQKNHEVAVIEMGMNHAGEITKLVQIAEPDAVVCTMVGRAHIEHFGSIEKIAEAKEEIYKASGPQVTRIYNLDNPYTLKMYNKSMKEFPQARKVTFSSVNEKADLFLQIEKCTLNELSLKGHLLGEMGSARVPVFGRHNLTNLLSAAGLALCAGLEPQQVWSSFEHCKTNWGRNQWLRTSEGIEILFDAYNANPDSMSVLLENLQNLSGYKRKIGVFAQMKELGAESAKMHFEFGQNVGRAHFDFVYFYGDDYENFAKGFVNTAQKTDHLKCQAQYSESLYEDLRKKITPGDLLAVKGSRGMKLEQMILPLKPIGFTATKE